MVGHRHRLAEAFGFIIDAARADRVDIAPIRFRLRVDQRVAIHFGRAGQQKAGILGFGQTQRFVRPQRADLQGRDRQFEVVLRTGRRSEMEHRIKGPVHVEKVADVILHEAEPFVPHQMRHVLRAARDEIIYAYDVVPQREQGIAQVTPQETGSARDEHPHPMPQIQISFSAFPLVFREDTRRPRRRQDEFNSVSHFFRPHHREIGDSCNVMRFENHPLPKLRASDSGLRGLHTGVRYHFSLLPTDRKILNLVKKSLTLRHL